MNNRDAILFNLFFITLILVCITVAIAYPSITDVGCHIIGVEVNGDYSTEYLQMGSCI